MKAHNNKGDPECWSNCGLKLQTIIMSSGNVDKYKTIGLKYTSN